MALSKRELAFEAERPGADHGDWWHLILDPEAPGLYVEHTWKRMSRVTDGEAQNGMERFGINDFLTLAQGQPAREMLIAALSEMFRTATPK
jgi:hypothetical protein